MGPFLERSDIVGHRVRDVLQTPWIVEPQEELLPFGYSHCRVFVLLDNTAFFELFCEDEPAQPIPHLSVDLPGLISAELPIGDAAPNRQFRESTIGHTVEEVVSYDAWVSFGLLLDTGAFLCRIGGTAHLGVALDQIWSFNKPSEFLTYWSRQPLPQFAQLQAQAGDV